MLIKPYLEGGAPHGWGYAFDGDGAWSFYDDIVDPDAVYNEGSAYADMNIWAYRGGAVPEGGATAVLLGLGLGLLASRKRSA